MIKALKKINLSKICYNNRCKKMSRLNKIFNWNLNRIHRTKKKAARNMIKYLRSLQLDNKRRNQRKKHVKMKKKQIQRKNKINQVPKKIQVQQKNQKNKLIQKYKKFLVKKKVRKVKKQKMMLNTNN